MGARLGHLGPQCDVDYAETRSSFRFFGRYEIPALGLSMDTLSRGMSLLYLSGNFILQSSVLDPETPFAN